VCGGGSSSCGEIRQRESRNSTHSKTFYLSFANAWPATIPAPQNSTCANEPDDTVAAGRVVWWATRQGSAGYLQLILDRSQNDCNGYQQVIDFNPGASEACYKLPNEPIRTWMSFRVGCMGPADCDAGLVTVKAYVMP